MAREDMAETFRGHPDGAQFCARCTYAGNPLACAVGIAVLDEIEASGLCERAREQGAYLQDKLQGLTKYGRTRGARTACFWRGLVRDTQTMEFFGWNGP